MVDGVTILTTRRALILTRSRKAGSKGRSCLSALPSLPAGAVGPFAILHLRGQEKWAQVGVGQESVQKNGALAIPD
jgi:hypothetical protein